MAQIRATTSLLLPETVVHLHALIRVYVYLEVTTSSPLAHPMVSNSLLSPGVGVMSGRGLLRHENAHRHIMRTPIVICNIYKTRKKDGSVHLLFCGGPGELTPTWDCTSVCSSSSRGPNALFWPLQASGTYVVHMNAFRQNTHTCEIK